MFAPVIPVLWMLAVVAFSAVFVGTIVSVVRAVRRPPRPALEQVAALLADAQVDEAARTVTGTRHGVPLTFRIDEDGRTRVEAETGATDLVLSVRGRNDVASREQGSPEAPGDVDLGDATFEDAFVVRGSPGSTVRHILDAAVRARLTALSPVVLEASGGHLHLEVPGLTSDDAASRADLVDLGAMAAARPAHPTSPPAPAGRAAPPVRSGVSMIVAIVTFSVVVVTAVVLVALLAKP